MGAKLFFNSLVIWHDNMSHVTCMQHVVMCHDVSLACECLVIVTFIFRFMFRVRIHVLGSHLQFVI